LPSRDVAIALVRSYFKAEARTVSPLPPEGGGHVSVVLFPPRRSAGSPLATVLPCGVRTFLTALYDEAARSSGACFFLSMTEIGFGLVIAA